MNLKSEDNFGLIEVFFGLIMRPVHTVELLLRKKDPAFVIWLWACMFLAVFTPIFFHYRAFGFSVYRPEATFVIGYTCSFTLLLFVFLETLFLRILGIEITVSQLVGSIAYALVPFTLFVALVYILNFLFGSNITPLTALIAGKKLPEGSFLRLVPFALVVCSLYTVFIFLLCLRFIGRMHNLTAAMSCLLSILPLYLAFYLSIIIAELTSPGAATILMEIFMLPQTMLNFGLS